MVVLNVDLGAGGAADPVALLDLHALDEVHIVQIVDQTLGVGGDLQHPLALLACWTTSLPQRSHTPSTTSSLASTHLQLVHQLTGIVVL